MVCDKRLGFCDFIPIKSLKGVIISNFYDGSFIELSTNLPKSRLKKYSEISKLENLDDFK